MLPYYLWMAALDWYMDNSQTRSLAAAKYWIDNIETLATPGFGFGCDVTQPYCSIGSWSDWPSEGLGVLRERVHFDTQPAERC